VPLAKNETVQIRQVILKYSLIIINTIFFLAAVFKAPSDRGAPVEDNLFVRDTIIPHLFSSCSV
jgi:hypothetical protein